jgi:Copper type II ascorbate-dependent monooxygenase, C-terminal domain
MMRTSKTKVNLALSGTVLALAVGLIACSSAKPTGSFTDLSGGDPNANDTSSSNGGSSSGGGSTQSTSSSGGSTTSSGSGATSGGSSGGKTSSSSSGGGSSSGSSTPDSGTTTTSNDGIPSAPGVSVGPVGATDLAVPPSDVGIQFSTVAKAYAVQPNQEIFPNFCVTVPKDIQVGGFQSWMSEGSSHHFILYKGATGGGSTCSLGANNWMYASSTPGQVVTENWPANVGLSVPNGTQLILNMHFINPGTTVSYPQIKVNLLFAKNVMYQAGTMVSFNTQINIPGATSAGPGTQTVSGTCSAPAGAKFFTMSTHTHKHATAAWIDFIHAGSTTEIVHTGSTSTYPADQEPGSGTDWEHPGVGLWTAPNFLTIQSGDSFTYHCSYSNTATTSVTVGETAASNEMCMAIGYYFPAGSASCY